MTLMPENRREVGDNVFGHAVGKIILLRIAAHVAERQYGDNGFVAALCRKRLGGCAAAGLGGGAIGNLICKLLCFRGWLNAEFIAQTVFSSRRIA